MGNYVSRKLSHPIQKNSRKLTKVILPNGEIRQIKNQPTTTKAAELMMDVPNFFITDTKTLKMGKRFCPLNADDDLENGNVYIMFPMHRKNSVVTAGDMAALFMTANKVLRRASVGNNSVKVLPESESAGESCEEFALPRLSLEDIEEVSTPEFRHRISMSRSKKPVLETIEEESIFSR
ncbi:uncharacterized protein LOC126678859 [Mercurialis annua]|uniref:uncharacterized protein LOC126678859 n=1 Tax=Mercurialis annua TaxID=3986 RepID=UPI002160F4D1|nr:uncharacterized protein LOC126678859 [Mercurialis annua]